MLLSCIEYNIPQLVPVWKRSETDPVSKEEHHILPGTAQREGEPTRESQCVIPLSEWTDSNWKWLRDDKWAI